MRGGAPNLGRIQRTPSGQPRAVWGRGSRQQVHPRASSIVHKALSTASAPDRQRVGKCMEQAGVAAAPVAVCPAQHPHRRPHQTSFWAVHTLGPLAPPRGRDLAKSHPLALRGRMSSEP